MEWDGLGRTIFCNYITQPCCFSHLIGNWMSFSQWTSIWSDSAGIWLTNLKFCDRLQNFEDASDQHYKLVFLIFPPLHSAPNPPMSHCFTFSLCYFGLFPSSLRSSPHSLCHFCSLSALCLPCLPLFSLDQTHTSPVSLTLGTLSCLQPFHRNEQIWWSILSLSPLFASAHTHTHTPQTAI